MQVVMKDPETLKALLDKAKTGDRAAFDALVGEFKDRLASRIESWSQFQLGPSLDPEEILQDTFIRALGSLDTFRWKEEDTFFHWLSGIAKHALADLARRKRRDERRSGGKVSGGRIPAGGPTPSKVLRRDERFERLQAALNELSSDYRQVLVLSRIKGLSMKEIAEQMGRSQNSVKHLIARALKKLKQDFGDTESLHLGNRHMAEEDSGNGH
jgi:RNA polymerase sigma-70 factor (ECF subfamily)